MDITITARHFKAHDNLRGHIEQSLAKLEKHYDGIVSVNVILSYEKPQNSIKTAELHVNVYGAVIKAKEKSQEFEKSIDVAVEKAERQIVRYKSKQREKKKTVIRKAQSKV